MENESSENPAPIQTGIYTLPNELLRAILTLNANIDTNAGALIHTKRASQVCQTWREILESPSLWGKLIDLNILCREEVTDYWRNEVLRRCQGALLWIQGTVGQDSENGEKSLIFFAFLLSNHWSRIQRLLVRVEPVDDYDPMWEAMLQPAPHLEVFQVFLYLDQRLDQLHYNEALFSSAWQASKGLALDLFSDNAPSLRIFHTVHISVSPSASWLSNLRSISFTFPFTQEQTFQVLEHTPLLEHLTIKYLGYQFEPLSLPRRTLSHLSELVIFSKCLEDCNRILARIIPAPVCSLSLNADYNSTFPLTVQVLSETALTLSKYLKGFHQTHTATSIALRCHHDWFSVTNDDHPSGAFYKIRIEFYLETLESEPPLLTAFAALLTVTPTLFHSVSTLDLQLDVPSTFYTSFLSASTFPVVEVLDTPEETLVQFLQNDDNSHETLASHSQTFPFPFPTVKTLKLWNIKKPTSIELARTSPLILFLISRRQEAFPIKVLELDLSRTNADFGDLRHFGPILDQEAVGMTVKVFCTSKERGGVREAVCGGDNVTRLLL